MEWVFYFKEIPLICLFAVQPKNRIMSLDVNVYCKEISTGLIPKIVKRLNDFDMVVEIHPEFKFDQYTDTGFLPFKFRLNTPPLEILKNKDF